MPSVLTEAYFQDEGAAFDRLEQIVWPNGPVCPKCGCTGRIGSLKGVKDKKGRERLGLRKCYDCRAQFTVHVGTVFERSHVALHVWFQAAFLVCSSKKGVSANQLHRTLGVSLQTGWFIGHRLREAMRVLKMEPLGGPGKHVEADETFIGQKKGFPRVRGVGSKMKVHSLVERGGHVRSTVLDSVTRQDVERIIRKHVHPGLRPLQGGLHDAARDAGSRVPRRWLAQLRRIRKSNSSASSKRPASLNAMRTKSALSAS
jgi:transposase-like protein